MTLRSPRSVERNAPLLALDYEIAQEQATALGRLGRALEAALAALSNYDNYDGAKYDNAGPKRDAIRAELEQEASEALWCFMVQREACGLRDPRPVLRDYCVPTEVYLRMGIFRRR